MQPSFDLDEIVASLPQPALLPQSKTGGASKKVSKESHDIPADMSSYIEINKSSWMNIPLDTYIRYIDKENKWRPGARVKSIKQNADGSNSFVIGKFNPFIKKFTKWNVPFSNITTLYKLKEESNASEKKPLKLVLPPNISPEVVANVPNEKESNEEQILGQLGNKLLFEDGEIIRHKVESLEAEVQRMNDDMKSLVTLIKRIYTRLDKAGVP